MAIGEYIQDNWKTIVGSIAALMLLGILLGSGNFSAVLPGGQGNLDCGEPVTIEGQSYNSIGEFQQAVESSGGEWSNIQDRFNPAVNEDGVVVLRGELCEESQ
jgi:hypothetical protein